MRSSPTCSVPLAPAPAARLIGSIAIKVACSSCSLRELCLPVGLRPEELARIEDVVATRRKVKRGTPLFCNGETFNSVFAIRAGVFKTCVTAEDGRDQVTGFQMPGEIIGLDGIASNRHTCNAVALEDAQVCVMPFDRISELSREMISLQHHVHRTMSREIVRGHKVMLLLGSMRAEERLAAFLLNLVQRLHARGFYRSGLVLRMTHEEIGSYLGLTPGTISRIFSKFTEDGLIEVRQCHVQILDTAALHSLVSQQTCD
jgi:CRP/FNR family transcriptional regulator